MTNRNDDADYDVNIMRTLQGILFKDEEIMFSISFVSSKGFKEDPYN